jgi:hypothetical protein
LGGECRLCVRRCISPPVMTSIPAISCSKIAACVARNCASAKSPGASWPSPTRRSNASYHRGTLCAPTTVVAYFSYRGIVPPQPLIWSRRSRGVPLLPKPNHGSYKGAIPVGGVNAGGADFVPSPPGKIMGARTKAPVRRGSAMKGFWLSASYGSAKIRATSKVMTTYGGHESVTERTGPRYWCSTFHRHSRVRRQLPEAAGVTRAPCPRCGWLHSWWTREGLLAERSEPSPRIP